MNDYLTNLAARSFSPAPALQPRLRSSFEPAPADGALGAAQPSAISPDAGVFNATGIEIESRPAPSAGRRVPQGHHDAASDEAEAANVPALQPNSSVESISHVDEPVPEPSARAPRSANETPIEIGLPQPLLTIRPPAPPSPNPPAGWAGGLAGGSVERPAALAIPATPFSLEKGHRMSPVQPAAETVELKMGEPGAAEPKTAESSARTSLRTSPRRGDGETSFPGSGQEAGILIREEIVIREVPQQSRPDPHSGAPPATEIETTGPRRKLLPLLSGLVVARPRVTPIFEDRGESRFERGDGHPEPAGGAGLAAPATQAAPVVHVTIGRIEVRATPAPSPSSSKPRAAQTAMSLDDYLRRRGNGGAR